MVRWKDKSGKNVQQLYSSRRRPRESPAMNDSQFSQIPLKHSVLEVVLVLYFAGLADDQ